MSAYTKAASFVLDTLWEDDDFRDYFYDLDTELADLGPLSQTVFEPAYVHFKNGLDEHALQLLESQVTTDLLGPLYDRKGFREMWDQWDPETRNEFIQEQSELQLAKLLVQVYDRQLDTAYRQAYAHYLAAQETHHS
jgi:hypothetical protein